MAMPKSTLGFMHPAQNIHIGLMLRLFYLRNSGILNASSHKGASNVCSTLRFEKAENSFLKKKKLKLGLSEIFLPWLIFSSKKIF